METLVTTPDAENWPAARRRGTMCAMRLAVVSIVGLLLAACDASPEERAHDLCSAVCNCMSASPAVREACIADCVPDVPADLPDECIGCVYQYSQTCGDLFSQCFDNGQACD
jgi:hypothetical protein